MPWWPPIQRRRNRICWRIVKSLVTNCSELLVFGPNWKTWYFVVCEQTCSCYNKMNKILWQTFGAFDIHHTCEYEQYCYVGNTAKQCRLGLFQDSDFARDLEDSESISGGTLCVFGSHTFVPFSWMCKKQTSASYSSTESEIISLDARLSLDGIPALDLWNLIVAVLHGNTYQNSPWTPSLFNLSTRKRYLHGPTIWTVMQRNALGMLICQPSKRTIFINVCGRYQNGKQNKEHETDLENSDERRWSGRTNFISRPRIFGLYWKRVHNK